MAKSIVARRNGDIYQARVFWLKLLELRTNDYMESITFESDEVCFVDDIVVSYREPILDHVTGRRVVRDLFQCKYHMTLNDAFTCENLTLPDFTKGKTSMLRRLYDAYVYLSKELSPDSFRLYVVSNWNWDHRDAAAKHIHEGLIRSTFYEMGPRSGAGKARRKLAAHLSVTDDELRSFLENVRFDLGKDLVDLIAQMGPRLELAGLHPINPALTNNPYDALPWELFGQECHSFNNQTLNQMIHEEKLIAPMSEKYSEISIQSFTQYARRPSDLQAAHLDLREYFDRRLTKDDSYWKKAIPEQISTFLLNEDLGNLPQPIHLFFDCHLSMAFLAGHLISPKHRIEIIPTQKLGSEYALWSLNARGSHDQLWEFKSSRPIGREVVLGISVTHDVRNRLNSYLEVEDLHHLPQILVYPSQGVNHSAVSGGNHAWQLGSQLAKQLREMLPATCHTIHLFYAGPVALAYILGHKLRYVTESVQLYELDFEGQSGEKRYYPSLRVS